jgi:NADH-quinone oxidoreductase subunit D
MSTTDERTAGPASGSEEDPFGAAADAAEGQVYTVTGQDWDSIVSEQAERGDEASWSTWAHGTRPRTVCSG